MCNVTSTALCCYFGWQISVWVQWNGSQSYTYLLSNHVTMAREECELVFCNGYLAQNKIITIIIDSWL